ncbi:DUF1513 domain-containing protein [Photobacterium andalusiense]|uniref:DUF1513 domain-containing protein n=1 Tax=Photobacterium andalusiense TaxID=2204296 RepID=A0A1Y6M7H4_9GAMM|nr:DUF1513 domain-containing protein [Photobacterium andalusiense]SMY32504.1 hypothetical protein PAND9192_00463 [Photobacterium andalusiense]
MQLMVTDLTRRKLLNYTLSSTALLPLTLLSGCKDATKPVSKPVLIGCCRTLQGHFAAAVIDKYGELVHQFPLPARGHGIALQPNGTLAAIFSRRPGQYIQIVNYNNGATWSVRAADPHRYFYGHGVFSADGRYLYATEGEALTSRGIIGVYELIDGLPKVAEFNGVGIGPHQMISVDEHTLAVAVGGIHTLGRVPQNLASMQSALMYIDKRTGEIVDLAQLANKHLSIRHLDVTADGNVICGQQYKAKTDITVPLVAMHRRNQSLQPLFGDDEQWQRFNHYISSVVSLDNYVLATSPRGNCYGIWNSNSRELLEIKPLADVSGATVINKQWVLSSGSGNIAHVSITRQSQYNQTAIIWDNHWCSIPVAKLYHRNVT